MWHKPLKIQGGWGELGSHFNCSNGIEHLPNPIDINIKGTA